jgi:hypothetical protein
MAGSASAQELNGGSSHVSVSTAPAPTPRSIEITVATGYMQAFGRIRGASGYGLGDMKDGGLSVDVSVGYRLNPRWHFSVLGEYEDFGGGVRDSASDARSLVVTLSAAYHLAPSLRWDPWLELGSGYRVLVETPTTGDVTSSYGFEIARVMAGVDLRTSNSFAIGPLIGADVSTFVQQEIGSGDREAIHDPRLSTFVFAGLQGRFDLATSMRTYRNEYVAR